MNITTNKEEMIFRNDNEKGTFYSIGLSKKLQDETYESGYINCQFKKGVDIPNKTKINIKEAWLSFYKKDKTTIPFVFVNDFEIDNKTQTSDLPF